MLRIRVSAGQDGGYCVQLFDESKGAGEESVLLASEALPGGLDAELAPVKSGPGPVEQSLVAFLGANEESAEYGPIGDWLAGLILRGRVATEWEAHAPVGQAIRTVLEVEPANLALLPWELMRRNGILLFVNDTRPFARAIPLEPDSTQDLVPLRLLVVKGVDAQQLGTDDELGGITAAIPAFGGRIDVRFLSEPTQTLLWQTFTEMKPHVLHFSGHGFLDPFTKQAALQVSDWILTTDHIINVMPHVPRVVVLNACRTGTDVEQIQSLTSAFLVRRAAAVVGMRGDIRGKSAACFGVELYRSLAAGRLIDEAVTLARRAVYGSVGVIGQNRNWALPSLTLRVQPQQVLPVTCSRGLTEGDLQRISTRLFEPSRLFVNRVEARSKVISAIDPDEGSPQRLLVLLGIREVGKTLMVNWVRTRSALRGRRVRYVNLDSTNRSNFLRALDVIRDTPDDLTPVAPQIGAYDRYDYDLGYALQGQVPPEPDGPLPRVRTEIPAAPNPGNQIQRIFTSFCAALNNETRHDPLLLIIDHVFGVRSDEFRDYLYPYLIKQIAEGQLPNVRVVLVLTSEQRLDYLPSDEPTWQEIPVEPIKPDEFTELARQVLYMSGKEVGDVQRNFIDAWLQMSVKQQWPPTKLLNSFVQTAGA